VDFGFPSFPQKKKKPFSFFSISGFLYLHAAGGGKELAHVDRSMRTKRACILQLERLQ
jgi:hypothetical protein